MCRYMLTSKCLGICTPVNMVTVWRTVENVCLNRAMPMSSIHSICVLTALQKRLQKRPSICVIELGIARVRRTFSKVLSSCVCMGHTRVELLKHLAMPVSSIHSVSALCASPFHRTAPASVCPRDISEKEPNRRVLRTNYN
jgi:hypothetical protein